jgi:ribosomal protein S6
MFLFDSAAARDWAAIEGEIRRLFDRIGAQAELICKYDERRLAYEIKKRKRGLFVLTIFQSDTQKIGELERDARLSESVLRLLVTVPEGLTEAKLAEWKAHPATESLMPHSESRRDDHDDRPRDRDFRDRDRDRDRDRGDRRFGGDREEEGVPAELSEE